MVYTITCNPSLDYGVTVENFQMGHTNRTVTEQMNVGGKGINVSIVLKHLGIPTKILGFTAGFIGREIEKRIKEQEIEAEWIRLPQGDSRINVKLLSNEGTEINGQGPAISKREVQELEEKLGVLTKEDVLVLAGNVQKSLGQTFYADMMKKLKDRQIRTVVDASGELLKAVLPYHPFLIKPNNHELGEIFHTVINDKDDVCLCETVAGNGSMQCIDFFRGRWCIAFDRTWRADAVRCSKGRGAKCSWCRRFHGGRFFSRLYGACFL